MIVEDRNPTEPGTYVAYVNPDHPQLGFSKRIFLFWDNSGWHYPMSDQRYRSHVYAWIGPLPVLKFDLE